MYIGIDLGGSHVSVGLIDNNYKIIEKLEENLSEEEKITIETSIVNKINANIEKILKIRNISLEEIKQIGIACPRNNT